ncbi:MAG: hypothetical protein ACLP7Q_27110 [Isosphaeraceae bacterium]
MTLPELQACLERLGIRLSARGDRLHFAAPKGAMTPEIRDALASHKSALLALLASPSEATPECEATVRNLLIHDEPGPWYCDSKGVISCDRPQPVSPSEPASEPQTRCWTAPNLTTDEVAAVESILAWPLDDRTSWAELIEAGRAHNAAVLARRGKT